MTIPRMAKTMAQLWQGGARSAHRLNEQTHGWLGVVVGAALGVPVVPPLKSRIAGSDGLT
jgi:hypothetical protein